METTLTHPSIFLSACRYYNSEELRKPQGTARSGSGSGIAAYLTMSKMDIRWE
jgi:hypothetical protein